MPKVWHSVERIPQFPDQVNRFFLQTDRASIAQCSVQRQAGAWGWIQGGHPTVEQVTGKGSWPAGRNLCVFEWWGPRSTWRSRTLVGPSTRYTHTGRPNKTLMQVACTFHLDNIWIVMGHSLQQETSPAGAYHILFEGIYHWEITGWHSTRWCCLLGGWQVLFSIPFGFGWTASPETTCADRGGRPHFQVQCPHPHANYLHFWSRTDFACLSPGGRAGGRVQGEWQGQGRGWLRCSTAGYHWHGGIWCMIIMILPDLMSHESYEDIEDIRYP